MATTSNSFMALPVIETTIGSQEDCAVQYQGSFLGINFQPPVKYAALCKRSYRFVCKRIE